MITRIQIYLISLVLCFGSETKRKLTIDDFFNSTDFLSLTFSPSGEYLSYQTLHPAWNEDLYEYSLWLYDIQTQEKKLIKKNLGQSFQAHWSPGGNWIAFLSNENLSRKYYRRSLKTDEKTNSYLYLYSILSNELYPIQIDIEIPSILTWSDNDSSLYLVTVSVQSDEEIVPYRQRINNTISTIHRIDIDINNRMPSVEINPVKNFSFLIEEMLYVPFADKLIFISASILMEDMNNFEIYSLDLNNSFELVRLTNNQEFETELQLSYDGQHILYRNYTRRSNRPEFNDTQGQLCSLDLTNGRIERLGKDFHGNIIRYTPKSDGGVYLLGQLGTEVHIYMQQSSEEPSIHLSGWNGSYERISSSRNRSYAIAFVYSSSEKAKEIYFIDDINQLQTAQSITNENFLFTQRDIPKTKVYRWKNEGDNQVIEGILHYPPDSFESTNLSLLVLIHGGPYDASLNDFQSGWYNWAPLAATQGWLVLEPNYCGSTGYGDHFVNDIRYQPLTRPTRDILSGVDQLIKDGIVNPTQLTVGGYSYGGFLTNRLITQTTRFNAALSGAGAIDHTSAWGTMDLPVIFQHFFGDFPWNLPHIYQTESPIYQLGTVRTPTLIVTGEKDVRVNAKQSYMLERGLHYLGVPVKLIIFPNEGHELDINPWHGKIKVREELRWLQKYGHQPLKNMAK